MGVYRHLTTVSLNGSLVGSAVVPSQSRITGSVAPQSLFLGGSSPTQNLSLRSTHTNGTHYTVASGFTVTVDYDEHTRTGCFTQAEIDAAAGGALMCTPNLPAIAFAPNLQLELEFPEGTDTTRFTFGEPIPVIARISNNGLVDTNAPVSLNLSVPGDLLPSEVILGTQQFPVFEEVRNLEIDESASFGTGDDITFLRTRNTLDEEVIEITYLYPSVLRALANEEIEFQVVFVPGGADDYTVQGTATTAYQSPDDQTADATAITATDELSFEVKSLSPLAIENIQVSSDSLNSEGDEILIAYNSLLTIRFNVRNISDSALDIDNQPRPVIIIPGPYGTVDVETSTDDAVSFVQFIPASTASFSVVGVVPSIPAAEFQDGRFKISLSQLVGGQGLAPGASRQVEIQLRVTETTEYAFELRLVGSLKESGAPAQYPNGEFYSNFAVEEDVLFEVPTTHIDFNSSGLRAMMFWAIYNETSEGRNIVYNPLSLDCVGDGWTLAPTQDGQSRQIFWVVRDNAVATGQSNDGRCRDASFIEANISINGVINAERNPANRHPNTVYTYFTTQYSGSIGNVTGYPDNVPDTIKVYENPSDPNDPDNGTNMLWMVRECWLNGDSYRTVLASGDQQRVFNWHQHYLECRANNWLTEAQQGNPLNAMRFALYQSVYGGIGGQNGLIDAAISNFTANCVGPNSISDVSDPAYRQCDPSNGAFSRVFANHDGDTAAFQFSVATCTGADLQAAFTNAQTEMGVDYRDLMRAIGSPDFGGTPGNYVPAYSAILQPVLRIEREDNGRIHSCLWLSNAYVQAANAFHYPR